MKKRKPAIKGITHDAKTLGVTHSHLWRVLTGKRESIPLTRRYRELKRNQKASA